jgi:hypothetical protein
MERRICKGCLKLFESNHGLKKYCSSLCYPHSAKPLQKKTCKNCGKEFMGYTGRFFCNVDCLMAYNAQQKKLRAKELREKALKMVCLWCHEEFSQKIGAVHIYCCNECGVEYRRVKKQIYNSTFDHDREFEESEKLRQLGNKYVLPEVG